MSYSLTTKPSPLETKVTLGDIVRIALQPDCFYTYDFSDSSKDTSLKVYNEFEKKWKKTPHPVGKIIEVFRNQVEDKIFIAVHCRTDNLVYNVAMHNVLEKLY
jgi:hypothetical protein